MRMEPLKQRLRKDRPSSIVSIRMPEDVVEDLKRIAPMPGFSGYQPLMRAYIGQELRADLARLEQGADMTRLVESLRRQGISEQVLATAVAEAQSTYEV